MNGGLRSQRFSLWFLFHALQPLAIGVLVSETADPDIVADGLGVLLSIPDHLESWIKDLELFTMVCKTSFDPVLVFVPFCQCKRSIGTALTSKIRFFSSMTYEGGDQLGR